MEKKNKNIFNQQELEFVLTNYFKSRNISKLAELYIEKFELPSTYRSIERIRKKISRYLINEGITNSKLKIESSEAFKKASTRLLGKKKYYIVTWQQNGTPIDLELWENIKTYANFLDADISVILGRYKNTSSKYQEFPQEEWDEETMQFWDSANHVIGEDLELLSNVKITPTRKYPLTGVQAYTPYNSMIIGHPRLHLKVCPTVNPEEHKILYTTGAISLPNYTDTISGELSYLSHKMGFLVVEVDRKNTYVRQVEADSDSSFIDLCYKVKESKVVKINKAKALVCGDTHHWHLDKKIDKQNDLLCDYFNIENVILHDVVDGQSCNNHIIHSPTKQYIRYSNNEHLIEKELNDLAKWLTKKVKYNLVIPQANHNSRFDRVLDNDWRKDIPNSLFYLDYASKLLKGEIKTGVIPYFIEQNFGDKIRCLDFQESFRVGKYECSQHGDYGSNGARGSATTFRNMQIPIILAHTHTPFRADDCFYVGTNTNLSLDYNQRGSSSWVQSNVIIGENGLAQHIIFKKGKFTTFNLTN